ncbi:MAG TPA: PAS domain S-box protein [Acidimicrobiales bacterium]|nr:PAS domain S-box protein [Acidimicrobiales bacterium]
MSNRDVSIANYEQFFGSSSDLMAVVDLDGNFVQVNPAYRHILGWEPDDLIGQPCTDYFHPDELERVTTAFDPVDGVTPSAVELDVRERCHDDTYRWMNWTIRRDGDLYYAVGHDITHRRETYEALAVSMEKSRAIFDAAVDSIVVVDKDLHVVEASSSNDMTFAFTREETKGRSALDFVHPEDQEMVREALERGFVNDEVIKVRFRGLHTDGHWVTIESRGRVLHDAQGDVAGAVVISRDVTESVEAERALQLAKDEAERANVAKSEFMSRMSHELRTPLNSVLGFAQILQMELQSPNELEMISYIVKSGGYLLELINEVLDISRVETGSIAVSLELVSLDALVIACLNVVSADAVASGVEIINHCESNCLVRADPQHLQQVLVNLLSNAIKYNHAGGAVTLTCDEDGDRVRLHVTDTGPGVAPQLHDRLFAPFDRLDAASKGIEGTGLGLALSKGLMESIGGSLGVESQEGAGSTFWIELPLATTSANFLEASRDADSSTHCLETLTATVLYIEDNVGNVRLMERLMVHRPNVRLITALEGRLGLELARQHRPDLILLDVHMPDLSGYDVLELLRDEASTASIPVVMLSADASHEQVQKFSDAGARDYLTKPLDLRIFLSQLEFYLSEQ